MNCRDNPHWAGTAAFQHIDGENKVDFRGILIVDHVPQMVGDRRTGWAYSIGYIRALYDMARAARPKG